MKMKRTKTTCKVLKVFFSIMFCISVSSSLLTCKSMDDLLEEYNQNFTSANSTNEKDSSAMIKDLVLIVNAKTSFMIGAPDWVSNCKWTLYEEVKNEKKFVETLSDNNYTHHFGVNDAGKDFLLELKATSNENGESLEDKISIYVK